VVLYNSEEIGPYGLPTVGDYLALENPKPPLQFESGKGGPGYLPRLLLNMRSAAKIRENLAQVQILLQHAGLGLHVRTKLVLAKARLKRQLLALEMRSQLRAHQP
jgi:hypothetical protein